MKFTVIMPGDEMPFEGELEFGTEPTPGDRVTVRGKPFLVVGVETHIGNTERPWSGEILAIIKNPTTN